MANLQRPLWYNPFIDSNNAATLEMQRTFNDLFAQVDLLCNDLSGLTTNTTSLITTLQAQLTAQAELIEQLQTALTEAQDQITALDARVTGFHP